MHESAETGEDLNLERKVRGPGLYALYPQKEVLVSCEYKASIIQRESGVSSH